MARIARLGPALGLGLCFLVALPAAAQARAGFRITGGGQGDIARTPWMAALLERGTPTPDAQFCGAAVIAPQAVVTAAHCVEDASANNLDVLTGRTRLDGAGGQRIGVAAVRIHPGYSNQTSHDDIAVLLLKTPTTATPLAVAGPADAALAAAGRPVLIAGWGTTSTNGGSSDTLLEGTQVVRDNARCEKSWTKLFDARTQFCAVGPNGGRPDTCPGDSGGPLVATGADGIPRQVGLVSFGGEDCGVSEPPSVYTRVSAFAAWVAQQAGTAPPVTPTPTPDPAPPARTADVKLRFGRFECGFSCRVEVRLSGADASAVTSVAVRAIGPGGRFDRTVAAKRVTTGTWRGQIVLPYGKDRVVAVAYDGAGKPTGNKPKTTITIVPAR
jgi:secreted trypsin-like serine protease